MTRVTAVALRRPASRTYNRTCPVPDKTRPPPRQGRESPEPPFADRPRPSAPVLQGERTAAFRPEHCYRTRVVGPSLRSCSDRFGPPRSGLGPAPHVAAGDQVGIELRAPG